MSCAWKVPVLRESILTIEDLLAVVAKLSKILLWAVRTEQIEY